MDEGERPNTQTFMVLLVLVPAVDVVPTLAESVPAVDEGERPNKQSFSYKLLDRHRAAVTRM